MNDAANANHKQRSANEIFFHFLWFWTNNLCKGLIQIVDLTESLIMGF